MLVVRLAGSVAIVLAVLSVDLRPRVTTIVQPTEHTTTTLAVPMPFVTMIEVPAAPATAPAGVKRDRCPAPRTDAVPHVVPPTLPSPVSHLIVAPTNASWVAAWSETDVYLSIDAGATFQSVLAGTADVRGVAFDCFGRALVMRDDRVGIHDPSTHVETWHHVPGMTPVDQFDPEARIASGGPDLVVLARFGNGERPTLAASVDDGATWQLRAIDTYWEGARDATLREKADGTLDVMFPQPDCMTTELYWGRTKIAATTGAIDPVVADRNTDWGENAALYEGRLAIVAGHMRRRNEVWQPIPGLPEDAYSTAIPGEQPFVMTADAIYRVVDGKAHTTTLRPGDARVTYADRAGRVWALACGQPYILTNADGPMPCGPAF